MFNVTVIKLRDIIRQLIIGTIVIFIIHSVWQYFNEDIEINLSKKISNIKLDEYLLYPIDTALNGISSVSKTNAAGVEEEQLIDENEDEEDKEFLSSLLDTAIKLQFGVVDENEENFVEGADLGENQEENETSNETAENDEIELATQDTTTEVVTENPIKETYTDTYNGVKIKNGTDYKLTDSILNPKNLSIDSSNIIIFHTHTCESYTQSDGYEYKASGNFRTTDLNYSVARVGDELNNYLTKYGFNVIHDKTYHDYPSYNGSYERSLSTVEDLLEKDDADIIIDLHRDAIGSNSSYAPTVKIGDDYCAQIMFVIGTDRWWVISSKLEE